MVNQKLVEAWHDRSEMYKEAEKLRGKAEIKEHRGDKLLDKNKFSAKGLKLVVEGSKLLCEAGELEADGDLLFIEEVLRVLGNVDLELTSSSATVDGETYDDDVEVEEDEEEDEEDDEEDEEEENSDFDWYKDQCEDSAEKEGDDLDGQVAKINGKKYRLELV